MLIAQQLNRHSGKMKKLAVVFISLMLIAFSADDTLIQRVKNGFQQFQTIYKPAQIDIFFNQPSYFPGDTVFFAARYSSTQNGSVILGRELLHFNLIDQNDSIIFHERAVIDNGEGSYQLFLPKELNAGNYKFYAYTNWMRNLGIRTFYKSEFVIEGIKIPVQLSKLKYFLNQKHLVAGVINELYVRTISNGLVKILSKDNDLVASSLANEDGLAILKFIPDQGTQYDIISSEEEKIRVREAIINGIAIQQTFVDGEWQVTLKASPNFHPQEEHALVIYNEASIILVKSVIPAELGTTKLVLPLGANGIVRADLVNSEGEVVNSIQWSIPKKNVIGQINLSNLSFSPRQRVSVDFKLLDRNTGFLDGNFSVRVIHQGLFQHALKQEYSLSNYPAGLNFDNKETSHLSRNSSLDWKRVLRFEKKPEFEKESAIQLSGRVVTELDGKPLPDSTRIMLFFQNRAYGYETYVKNGLFSLPILFDVDHHDNIFFTANRKGTSFEKLSIAMNPLESLVFDHDSSIDEGVKEFIKNEHYEYNNLKLKITESYNYFANVGKPASSPSFSSSIEEELGDPDYSLAMSNYLVLPSMADVVKELLKSVEYRKVNGKERIRVYVTNYNPKNSGTPLFIIDGKLSKDVQDFLSIDPLDVVSIKVFRDRNKLFRFGSLSADGVILVQTKRTVQLTQHNTVRFHGLLPKSKRFLIHQSESNSDRPDLRSCLYWNPNIIIGEKGIANFSFWTADDIGVYLIQIQGFTKSGDTFTLSQEFDVRKPNGK